MSTAYDSCKPQNTHTQICALMNVPRSRDKKKRVANNDLPMHGFNLKNDNYNNCSNNKIACLQVSNTRRLEQYTNTRCGRGHCRSYFHGPGAAADTPSNNRLMTSPGMARASLRLSACRALRHARTYTHNHLLILSQAKDQSTKRSFLTSQLIRSLNTSFSKCTCVTSVVDHTPAHLSIYLSWKRFLSAWMLVGWMRSKGSFCMVVLGCLASIVEVRKDREDREDGGFK